MSSLCKAPYYDVDAARHMAHLMSVSCLVTVEHEFWEMTARQVNIAIMMLLWSNESSKGVWYVTAPSFFLK